MAKRARQGMGEANQLRAYLCASGNGRWHLGHLRREYWTDDDEGV